MSYRTRSHDILLDYLDRLDRREKLEWLALGSEWSRISGTLRGLIEELGQKTNLTEDQLFRLGLYQRFLNEANIAARQFASVSAEIIKAEQLEFGLTGMESAQRMLNLAAKFYTKLPVEAIYAMIGNTREGTPLYDVLLKRYGENAEKAVQQLVDGMALGRNPLETARLMGETLDGSLYDSIRIARTEQLYVLREVQTESYITSGICTGKDWLGEPDACEEICQPGIEGSPYPLDEVMDTHPNCRCAWSPVI